MPTEREILVVTVADKAAEVWFDAQSFEEIVNTFGVVAQHCLSMVDPEHAATMLRALRHALDVAEERGGLGGFRLVEVDDAD